MVRGRGINFVTRRENVERFYFWMMIGKNTKLDAERLKRLFENMRDVNTKRFLLF
jgi:hypothetical protein